MQRPTLAANKRNHTKRAAIIASVLDLQIRTRPARVIAGFKNRCSQQFGVRENICDENMILALKTLHWNKVGGRSSESLCDYCGNLLFVRIANHRCHAGKGSELFWSALGVASGHDDLAARILPMNAPNGGTRILVG